MDWLAWLSLAGVCALGAMSPGPSLLIVVRKASSGFLPGAACAIAHGLAIGLYALLTALGLALVLTESPLIFTGLQWAGALFLLYLGWKAIRTEVPKGAPAEAQEKTPEKTQEQVPESNDNSSKVAATHAQPIISAAAQGFAVALFNPKVALFFAALFSQFVSEQLALTTKLAMAALAGGIDALWYLLVTAAIYFSHKNGFRPGRWSYRLQQLFGVLLIALAARLVWNI